MYHRKRNISTGKKTLAWRHVKKHPDRAIELYSLCHIMGHDRMFTRNSNRAAYLRTL